MKNGPVIRIDGLGKPYETVGSNGATLMEGRGYVVYSDDRGASWKDPGAMPQATVKEGRWPSHGTAQYIPERCPGLR